MEVTDTSHWAIHAGRDGFVAGAWVINAFPDAEPTETTTILLDPKAKYERIKHDHRTKTATFHGKDGSTLGQAAYNPATKLLAHRNGDQPHVDRVNRYALGQGLQ